MIRIGIIGTGKTVSIANNHYAALVNDGRAVLSAVMNSNVESAKRWVTNNNVCARVCSSIDEFMDSVDAVIICTPNNSHTEYAIKSVEHGKHFLLEKPMSTSIEDANKLVSVCSNSKTVDMMGFVYRYSNAAHAAQKIIKDQLGSIYTYTASFGGTRLANPQFAGEWRMDSRLSGSGALGDYGSHLIDLADFMAGQRYNSVVCMKDTYIKGRNNDDSAMFVANGPNGLGSYSMSRVGMNQITINIAGQGGMLDIAIGDNSSVVFKEKDIDGGYTGKSYNVPFEKQEFVQGLFDAQMKAFIDSIEGNNNDYADVKQGLYVDKVVFAADEAAKNKTTIEFN